MRLFMTVLLLGAYNSIAGTSPVVKDNLIASVDGIQKKFASKTIVDDGTSTAKTSTGFLPPKQHAATVNETTRDDAKDDNNRHDKMLDFYGYYPPYYPQPMMYPFAYYYPIPTPYGQPYPMSEIDDYEDDYSYTNHVDDEDDGSRSNVRRRPITPKHANSPIFYIRMPPAPYIFVPGMGYISQPPIIQPYALPAPLPPVNPFINLPLTFNSNGKPIGVYQWNPMAAPTMPMSAPYYYGNRPTKPYHHKSQYASDSKVTHLKNAPFNGRPEDIYVLPNSNYASPYAQMPNPYQSIPPAAAMSPHYNPYSSMYNSHSQPPQREMYK